jgi:hypothetical protein
MTDKTGNVMKKEFIVLLPLTILVTIVIVTLTPYAYDDAYIHFRISENFSRYFLPYFNLSEPVMSTSSFVWTSILAILGNLPFSLPVIVAILNSMLLIIGSVVWRLLLSVLSKKTASPIIFQIVYIGILLPSAAGLMETPLAMLLLGLSIFLLRANRPSGWILMGLAVFTRYEIFLFAGLFLLIWIFDKGNKKKITGIALFTIILILLSSMIYYFYSTVIPNTAIAKQIVYQISILSVFYNVIHTLFPSTSLFWVLFLFLLMGVVFLETKGTWKSVLFKSETRWNIGIFGGFLIALAYIIKHVFLHEWYVPLFSIPIVFGICLWALSRQNLIRLLTLIFFLVPFTNLVLYTRAAFISPSSLPNVCAAIRVQRYLQVGDYLNNLFPHAKLLSSEIGGIGYSFHGEIIDAVGLITPFALKYHPMKVPQQRSNGAIGAIPAKLVGDKLPELIVSYPIFVQKFDTSIYSNTYTKISVPAFSRIYEEKTNCIKLWGSEKLYIYIRNDIVTNGIISFLTQKLNN